MKRLRFGSIGLAIIGLLVAATAHAAQNRPCTKEESPWCIAPRLSPLLERIEGATVPKLATPDWMVAAAKPSPPNPTPAATRTVNFTVSSRGTITADMGEFRAVVAATLNDPRGWTRLGVAFAEVESGGQFTIYLSEASQMTTFSASGCDSTYSCRVGNAVVINQDRWLQGTPSWSGGGSDLASYRQMVINHETGHWLGHGHRSCPGQGQPAPVMQQQSISLQGCGSNPWPLGGELYAPNLGIRS